MIKPVHLFDWNICIENLYSEYLFIFHITALLRYIQFNIIKKALQNKKFYPLIEKRNEKKNYNQLIQIIT